MKYFLIGLTMVVSLLVIVVVVAQESKQAGMGSAIGGGAEGAVGGKTRHCLCCALSRAWKIYEYFLMKRKGACIEASLFLLRDGKEQ